MKEAGYPSGFKIKFWIPNEGDAPNVAQVVQQDLSKVGIKASIRAVSFSDYLSLSKSGKTQAGLSDWYPYPDPSDVLDELFNSAHAPGNNISSYSNPTVDKELNRGQYMLDHSKRIALYQKAQKQILADQPVVPLYYIVDYEFVSPKIGGFRIQPVWGGSLYANWYLKKK